ncbi:ribonuclease H-like domain-containing protein [Tanacetum coccineum]
MSHQSVSSSLLHTSSSSPKVLVASTTPHDKANIMSTSGFDVCCNFQRGSCSYGARWSMMFPNYVMPSSYLPLGYYASISVSNNDSSTTKLEHGYWCVLSSSREHRYKAQLVTNGSNQQQGIDCDETFSPDVKPATIHTVLSLAMIRNWLIHQLNVKNAFLNGQLSKTVCMHQPLGFVDFSHPDYVCHLQSSLYGLKQAPRTWFQRFAIFITRVSFQHRKTDTSLFVYHQGSDIAYLLLYVDDIVLTASSTALLQRIITVLHGEFAITDLGSLNYFLGISAQRTKSGLFLSQSKFAEEILERAHMQHCNPCKTPVDTESKLGSDGDSVSDPTLYHSLVGALQYLTFTRPDISYAVQQICLYMHDPRDPYFHALKRILRYVRGIIDRGLQLHVSYTIQFITFTDADWAGYPVTRHSTLGYCVFLGNNLLSWSAKRQVTLSRSSAEAKYHGVANVVAEAA